MSDSEKRYASDAVYSVDQYKKLGRNDYPRPVKKGDYYLNGKKYYVIDVEDNKMNGMQGMAIAPYKKGKPDYSHTIVSYAGTGDSSKGSINNVFGKDFRDLYQDYDAFVNGNRRLFGKDSQFISGVKFYDRVQKEVRKKDPNAKFEVTGHSLGGAIALVVASHFHTSAKVFSAPDPWKVMTNQERMWALIHPELLINFRHHGDLLSGGASSVARVEGFTGTIMWCKARKKKNPHDLANFEFSDGKKVRIVGDAEEDLSLLDARLNALMALRKQFEKSGGKLTKAEKIFLDAAAAASMADSLNTLVADGINAVIKDYNKGIEKFPKIWEKTVETSQSMATDLTYEEVIEALDNGDATRKKFVDSPTTNFQEKIDFANEIKANYAKLSKTIQKQVETMISTDKKISEIFKNE